MRFQPERSRGCHRIQSKFCPPSSLIAVAMELAMVPATKRNGELIADFATKRPLLCEAQMMGIRRYAAAQQARLTHDRLNMLSITNTSRFRQSKYTFVNPAAIPRSSRQLRYNGSYALL